MHVVLHASMHAFKYSSIQVFKYTSIHVCKIWLKFILGYGKVYQLFAKLLKIMGRYGQVMHSTATARFAKAIQSYARNGEVVQNYGKLIYVTETTVGF